MNTCTDYLLRTLAKAPLESKKQLTGSEHRINRSGYTLWHLQDIGS